MAPSDGGLHITLTVVDDLWFSDVTVGSPATGETLHTHHKIWYFWGTKLTGTHRIIMVR